MTVTDTTALNDTLALGSKARFEAGAGGLPRLAIATDAAEAHIYLHGAHLTHYRPAGAAQPLLFMSRCSQFAAGQPIRGGVPVCFPWFSGKPEVPNAPGHGFARLRQWQPQRLERRGDDVVVDMTLSDDDDGRAMWPHRFKATMRFVIGAQLEMTLQVLNIDDQPFTFTEAMHTYLLVGDVRQVRISGLEDADYHSKVKSDVRPAPGQPITFNSVTDRVYCNNTARCVLHDPVFDRRIIVDKAGSKSTVVWNPWIDRAQAMPDFGDEEWPSMVCIETANAHDDTVTLRPGETHEMTAWLRLS
jgi:glucose-6-phosphate 1-epimerase